MQKLKNLQKIKELKKRKNSLTYNEFKEITAGLSDDEINRFCDLLLNLQQKREER